MDTIKPKEVLYIKLGRGGEFEQECIVNGILRLGFREAQHQDCLAALKSKRWDAVQQEMEAVTKSKGAATGFVTQVRAFYESSDKVLWVTFYKNALWWCRSRPKVTPEEDGHRTRQTVDGWKNVDIHGSPLGMSDLSGALLMMQGFKGTICKVREAEYLVRKINGEQSQEVRQAEAALRQLEEKVEAILRTLSWRDFELLIDLIFRAGGWQRSSDLGKTIKTLDMELMAPITNERCGVQVKSQASMADFRSYRDDKLTEMQGFARFYFAVHSPAPDLTQAAAPDPNASANASEGPQIELLLPQDIASLAVRYGLARWIIDKAR